MNLPEYYKNMLSSFDSFVRIGRHEIDQIFDIGSRDFQESQFMLEHFENAKILAFEPEPTSFKNCEMIIQNLPPSLSKRCKIKNVALSNFTGVADFFSTPGNIGASSLLQPHFVPYGTTQEKNKIKVQVQMLDNIWKKKDHLCLVWMDVQGNELHVLQGAKETLKNDVVGIYTELGLKAYYDGHTLKPEIVKFLEEIGFVLVFEKPDHDLESNAFFVKKEFLHV